MSRRPDPNLSGGTEPPLHAWFPELRATLPHVSLGSVPTPVRPLPALTDGPAPLWLKDDAAFGTGGWGGNKVRKLEWLLPEARRRGAGTILTFGGLGTNWGLATALYGREQGLRTALALVDQPLDDHVRAQLERLRASGATLHFTHTKARTIATLPWLLARHAGGGRPPYLLPVGGSSAVGVLGYVNMALELAEQVRAGALPEPSHVVTAIGSGGTAAGLLLGLRLARLRTTVVGVVVNDALRLDDTTVRRMALAAERLLRRRGARLPPLNLHQGGLEVVRDWLGAGYGHPTPAGARATERAVADGLALDPVYTAKAVAAALDRNAAGSFGEGPVVVLQTNGPR